MTRASAIPIANFVFSGNTWYVQPYIPSVDQQVELSEKNFIGHPHSFTVERLLFSMKEVNTDNLGTCKLGTGNGNVVPIYIIDGYQQRNRINDKILNKHFLWTSSFNYPMHIRN